MATVIDATADVDLQHVGKGALCQMLGWSRPKLDLRLETDPRFPVLQRGVQGGGWRFDAAAVLAYLRGDSDDSSRRAGYHRLERPPSMAPMPGAMVIHSGEQSARQRRDAVQAEILEDKLRRDRSELVEVTEMKRMLAVLQAGINKGLDQLCDQIVALVGKSDSDAVVPQLVDELRETMVADLRSLLEPR